MHKVNKIAKLRKVSYLGGSGSGSGNGGQECVQEHPVSQHTQRCSKTIPKAMGAGDATGSSMTALTWGRELARRPDRRFRARLLWVLETKKMGRHVPVDGGVSKPEGWGTMA